MPGGLKRPLSDNTSSASKQPKLASIFSKDVPKDYASQMLAATKVGRGFHHFVFQKPKPSAKIAAFDIDGTIIKTKSGNPFPKDHEDWISWSQSEVKGKIRAAHADGYSIVLFSNQAGKSGQQTNFKNKLPLVARHLNVPLQVFAAFDRDIHRKPATGMWDAFVANFNGGIEIDYVKSYYIGDAAGRVNDHADTDRKFAINCGLPFYTPEEYFLDKPVSTKWRLSGFNAKLFDHSLPLYSPTSTPLLPRRSSEFEEQGPEVVIFVGSPGAGKSTFYKKHFAPKGYVHINQDTLRSRDACIKRLRESLSGPSPKSCIIDNTSPAAATRNAYLSILRSEFPHVKARCLVFTAPRELCMHNSVYRASYDSTDVGNGKKREILPEIAFSSFASAYQEPKLEEGFSEIKHISFKFEGTDEQRQKWERWLCDVYKQPQQGKKL
ncbi:hypothetical protein JCM5353_004491 [Sporobolomyces roseus]